MRKNLWGRIAAALMVLTVAWAMATPAYAVRKATIKSANYNVKRATVDRRATKLTKGTYKLAIAKGRGYAKFTAPAAGTYTFVLSDVADKSKAANCGYWFVMTTRGYRYSSKYIGQDKVPTNGGKATALHVAVNGYKDTRSKTRVDKYIASRYGRIKLKKGETAYFYFRFLAEKTTATFKIK